MAKVTMSIKLDEKLRKQAEKVAKNIGIPFNTVVEIFIKKFVDENMKKEPEYRMTPYLEKYLKRTNADFKAGKNISPAFSNVEDMRVWLEAD